MSANRTDSSCGESGCGVPLCIALKSHRQIAVGMAKLRLFRCVRSVSTNQINTYEISRTNSPFRAARCRRHGGYAFRNSPANHRHTRLGRRHRND